MSFELDIHRHNLQRVNNIFNGFEGQDMSKDISKAITEEEFHERFSAGYQVFTKGNIRDFVKAVETDLIEKGFDSNAISTALDNEGKTLESVLVKKDGKVFEVFVKAVEEDIEKGGGAGSRGGKVIGTTKSGKPIYAGKKLSSKEVDSLYDKHPEIEDPNHKDKEHVGSGKGKESAIFKIKAGDKHYMVHSDPHKGDSWHEHHEEVDSK